jgi:hypothetical protein
MRRDKRGLYASVTFITYNYVWVEYCGAASSVRSQLLQSFLVEQSESNTPVSCPGPMIIASSYAYKKFKKNRDAKKQTASAEESGHAQDAKDENLSSPTLGQAHVLERPTSILPAQYLSLPSSPDERTGGSFIQSPTLYHDSKYLPPSTPLSPQGGTTQQITEIPVRGKWVWVPEADRHPPPEKLPGQGAPFLPSELANTSQVSKVAELEATNKAFAVAELDGTEVTEKD